ncbi:Cacna1c [Symbiodinium microadriaticum]|nr:Cacna1c [Symbiodinium microadriaticum]
MYIEPFVAILIVLNGILIGFQTDPAYQDWPGWAYVDLAFQSFLLLEILFRMHFLRCRKYWWGPESWWNWFDLFLFGSGLADVILQFAGDQQSDIAATSLLRFCRLIRLVRIVKVFRIKFMRDLRLMVKGLIAGVRTLALAFVLLFAVLYVISGFAAMTIGNSEEVAKIGLDGFFYNIPASMYTAFRCFTGECTTNDGAPIHSLLADVFGLPFIACYVVSYMLVTMGIFNLILAVYVDITMKAAKENDAVTAEQYSRESIRIARTTRELLKKFSSAYHGFHEMEDSVKHSNTIDWMKTSVFTEEGMDKIAITKELFLLIIQDRGVQKLMDDLDLPPDRANLFEIIDADGSGTLQITELLHGLLKIRGEINKSDAVATLLATRSVQTLITEMKADTNRKLDTLRSELVEQLTRLRKSSTNRTLASSKVEEEKQKPPALPAVLELRLPCKPSACEEDPRIPVWPASPTSRMND